MNIILNSNSNAPAARRLSRVATKVLITLLLVCASPTMFAAEPAARDLFNGKNLDGWIVTNCEAEVRDGKLLLKDGNGFVQTKEKFGDFVLEVEYRPLKDAMYDCGIYIRCEPPDPAKNKGRTWPLKWQVNLKDGDEGNLLGVPTGGKSTAKDLAKRGDWNKLRLTVRGTTAEMEINGTPAWKADGLTAPTGHIGLQAEVPLGGQFEFKTIRLTELKGVE